jgi:hypothetical protein
MSAPSPAVESLLSRLDERVSAPALLAAGLVVLACAGMLESWVSARAVRAEAQVAAVREARENLDEELAERRAIQDLVTADLARAKANARDQSRSRRSMFEGGMALSEERRLLEKQWEIMTTYLLVDVGAGKLSVMRGRQTIESWPLDGAAPRAVGGDTRPLPRLATIVSKERWAHPERGKSEVVGGQLEWDPPQVGTSARARALGEDVLFTKEGLIIHGPPLSREEHEAYPHLCLSLPKGLARRVYADSFVGTRVLIQDAPAP